MLKNAESNVEHKGLDVDSLVIKHPDEQKAPQDVPPYLTEFMVRLIYTWVLPATLRWSSMKRNKLLLNQKSKCTKEKDIPEETEETKTYGMGINPT